MHPEDNGRNFSLRTFYFVNPTCPYTGQSLRFLAVPYGPLHPIPLIKGLQLIVFPLRDLKENYYQN